MSDSTTASLDDIKTSGSGFTFTGKLAEFAVNGDWVDGYHSVSDGSASRNDYSTMWEMLSAGTEESGNRIYREIRSYIDKIGNVDTCGLKALKNIADTIGFKDDLVDAGLTLPTEINGLVEIFSVNSAYLMDKADGVSGSVLLNSILDSETAAKFGDAVKDRDGFRSFVSNVVYNTIFKFLTLKVGKFYDGKTDDYDKEIWRCNISRFTTELWNDDVTTDEAVFELKNSLGVGKSFTEKIYADKVISGEAILTDFSYEEQEVISAEIDSRKTRYSDAAQMRYYFMRLYKVLEYFRFVSLTYRKIYELGDYDLNDGKFVVMDVTGDFSLVKNVYADYEIDETVVHKVADWIADFCIGLSYARTRMKRQSQKNMMKGTKRLIVDAIREFVLEQIDSDTWGKLGDSVLLGASLNRDFDVSLIEYTDGTEYFNIENDTDMVDPQKNGLNRRFWEKYGDSASAFSKDEVLAFYNRVNSDRRKYDENDEDGGDGSANLYEFLKLLFESGASSAINSDYFTVSQTLSASAGTETASASYGEISERTAEVFEKFSGDPDVTDSYYHNIKNSFHPSYQIHPFVQGFEEYNAAYTSVMNLVNSFSDTVETSIARLSDRIDRVGCTVNFWYNWNEDFTGYSTNYEKGGSDSDPKVNQDSPFDFDALREFITFPDEFVLNILQGINQYYKSELTGKPLLNSEETSIEISRLQRYRQDIIDVSGKAIYKYSKDFYGNIYVLYKDGEDRNNRNSLGNIWVRLKDHPMAFPLFDVNESSTPFSEVSCISDSDNERLIRLLKTVVRRFDKEYGIGGGYVDSDNLTLSFETKTVSAMVVTDGDGKPTKGEDTVVENGVGRINLQCVEVENPKLAEKIGDVGVNKLSGLPDELSSTEYFLDSVNGEVVNASFVVSSVSGGVTDTVSNPYGRICHPPTSAYLKATYENGVFTVLRNTESSSLPYEYAYVTFADYDDRAVAEEGVAYSYTNEYGITHPCGKRSLTIRSVYNIPADCYGKTSGVGETLLSGGVDSEGNVDFGVWSESGSAETVSTTAKATVDGTDIYENFDAYTYAYGSGGETYRYHPEKGVHDIVMVGGSNPYYVRRTLNDDSTTSIKLVKAWRSADSEPDTYVFRNKAYSTIVGSVALTSFPLSDCQFRKNARVENVLDTIHQFQTKDNQYFNYYPYTRIVGDPTEDIGKLDTSRPSGCITFYDDENDLVGHKFYYNIYGTPNEHTLLALSAKILTSETYSVVTTSKNVRLGGSLSLHTNDSSKYPVTLTFNGETDSNIGTFSTYYASNEYQKFFDMGFSYDQKMMYMAYREDDDTYENGGVLVGRIQEKENADGTADLVYYRDSGNNIEGVEPSNIRYYHQMSERMEYFRQDYLSGEPYFVLNTQIPFVNEKAMTFQSLNDALNGGETWQSLFMGTSSTDVSALTSLAETDTRMAYTTLTSITGLITSSMEYRTYVDGIRTRHLGETVSKNGIYSAFGSFNERDHVLNMTVYLFATGSTVASNFAIRTRFDPMVFEDDPRGRISTKLSCTDKRLYFSFASCPPASGDTLLNGINGDVNGDAGGTKYETVSASYGDSTVTILSFNIEDKYSVEQEEGETRYIFKGTDLGFFPQFGGIGGKNLVFRSASLSGKTEFPFEVAFDPVGSGEDVRMTRTVTVSGSDSARVGLSKFINLDNEFSYSSDARSRGILVTEGGDSAFYIPFERSVFNDVSKMYSFKNVDGRRILDVSRPHVNANSGETDDTVIIADGCSNSRYVGAISEFGASSAPAVRRIPISYSGNYDFKTDFSTIEDADGRVFALHSDGKTLSELEIGYRSDGVFLPESGIVSHTLSSSEKVTVYDISKCGTFITTVPEEGYDGFSNDAYAKRASAKVSDGGSTVIDVFDSDGGILQSRFSTSKDCVATFFSGTSAFVTVRVETKNNGAEFRVYPMEKDVAIDTDSPYATFSIEPSGQRITAFEDTLLRSANDSGNPTSKIFTTDTQRVYRLDIVTGGDSPVLSAHETYTFKKVVEDGILSPDTEKQNGVEVCIGHSENNILFSYCSEEQNAHGMVYSRKITPDSVGEYCTFVDESGNEVGVNRITRMLSMGSLVVAQDESGDSTTILVSTDDGITFVRHSEMVGCNLRLVGCGQYGFYAHSANGSLVRSSDGVKWKVDGTVPFSRWTSITVGGRQYLLCERKEGDTGGYYKDRYLEIRQQSTVDSDRKFTKVSVNGGVVVAASCEDPTLPLAIARADEDDLDSVETVVLSTVRGIAFANACGFGGDLFLSPYSSEKAVRIDGAFDLGTTPSCKYIDISGVGSSDSGSYGGFVELNGKLVMFPNTAADMLVYNEGGCRFFEYCSVGNSNGFADCDIVSVESDAASEAVLTPSVAESDGTVNLVVTNVTDRNNYGMVEIDDGFPILVEYSTSTAYGGFKVTQFRFTMMSDPGRRTATVTTVPSGVPDDERAAYEKKSSATVSYTVGNRTMIYTFSTVDDGLRYVISRSVDADADYEDGTFLKIRMSLDDFNRTTAVDGGVRVVYSSDSETKVSVYGDFSEGTEKYIQEMASGEGEVAITKFADYVFADSATFSGDFKTLSVMPRNSVADSNLSFNGGTSVKDCSDMFNGCVNAEMGESLDINGDDASKSIVAADRMFKDCRSATLPYVTIEGANIETCESMFENCSNAKLGGVGIPHGAKGFRSMFKNCRSASFDSLTLIPESVALDSVFYGCESGTFGKASFFTIEDYGNDSCASKGYEMPYMFYMCESMNAQSLSFQRVSPYVRIADRMFYGAGENSSVMFNDTVTVFGRLHSADRMFMGSNFEFDNAYMQFHGIGGRLRDGDSDSFSIPNDMTLVGIESFFEGTEYAVSSPTTVLASSDISVDGMDSALDGALYGHYIRRADGTFDGIMNFGSLYRGSSMKSLDLRGIANNADMDRDFNSNSDTIGRQTFASMCENCGKLKELRGYIPPYGIDYSSMFRNCSSLSVDLSKAFCVHAVKDGEWRVESAYSDGSLKSYNTSSISHMFDGCASIYSSDGRFDLATVVDSCAHTLSLLGIEAEDSAESFECAFGNSVVIAPRDAMDGLGSLDFSPDEAASRRNAVKYATTDALCAKYGVGTDFMKILCSNGFMRYCGTPRTDPTIYVAVIYYPKRDASGNVTELAPKTIGRTIGVVPYGFADDYAVAQTHKDSTWYEYDYDTLYAAAIFDVATNGLLKYAYVGEYDVIKHEYLISGGSSVRADSVSRASATVFSGMESTIEPLP